MSRNAQAVKKLNEAKAQRQAQLAQAYEDLGGSNPAYKPIQQNNVLARPQRMSSATIPQLEKAVMEQYENPGKPQIGNTGNIATDLSGYKGAKLNQSNLQQTYAPLYEDIRNRQLEQKFQQLGITNASQLPEAITMPTIMGQTNGAYGRPTPEMAALGITQDDIQRYLDPQWREKKEENARQLAESHPVLATGASIVSKPIESTLGTLQQIGDYVTGSPMRPTYNPANLIRETVSDNIDSNVGRVAYGGVTSVGDMAMDIALAKIFGGTNNAAVSNIARGLMGTEIANDAMNNALERGLNPDQVAAEGTLYALASYLTEKGPIDKMLAGSGIFKSAAREGIQEGLEDLVDTIFDQAVTLSNGNVDRSELAQTYNNYLGMGLSEAEAKRQTVVDYGKQLGIDALLGAITGGLMQGGTNIVSGRNAFTGNFSESNQDKIIADLNNMSEEVLANPTEEARAELNQTVESLSEELPYLKKRLDKVLDNFNEKYEAQTTVNEKADNVKLNVDNVNSNVDIPTVEPQIEQPEVTQTLPEVQPIESQPVEVPNVEPRMSRAEVSGVVNNALGIKDNLSLFNDKQARTLEKKIDSAVEKVRSTSGQAQIEAVQELNKVIDNVRTTMQDHTIGINERVLNADGFERMHNVTDGRKVKVTPSMLRDLNLSLTQLNNMTNTGTNNRIRFYVADNPNAVSLDSVWNEMVDLSGNELPNVAEGDQLQALIDYINEYKSKKGSEVNTVSFNDMPVLDSRSSAEVNVERITDNLFDLIEDGKMTGEDFDKATKELSEIAKKNPELSDRIFELLTQASNEYRARRYNADVDPDVANAQTYEELGDIIDSEIDSLDEIVEDATFPTAQPGVETGRLKESQAYTNTGENSGMTQQEKEIHSEKALRGETGGMLYQEVGEQESYEQAQKNLEEKGEKAESERLFHKLGWNQVDTDEAMTLLKQVREEAEAIEADGGDATNEWEYAADLFIKIQTEATNHAQALQALAKWSRVREDGSLTPEGRLAAGVRAATQATKVTNSETNLNAELAPKQFKKKFEFKKEFVADFLKAAREFDKQKNKLTVREQAVGEARLAKMIRQQIPMTLRERIISILMDDMLFSIRTLISRNAGGNAGLALVDQTITKLIAGGIDRAASQITGVRTTTGFTGEGLKRYIGGLAEGAKRTGLDYFKDDVNTWKPGQENDFESLINDNRRLFNDNGKNKALNKAAKFGNFLDRIVSFGLTFGDNPFYTAAYNQSLYEFDKLREQGWFDKTKDGKPITDEQFEKIKQSHSVINALTAVYQNDTALSRGLMEIRKGLAEASTGVVGLDVLTQAAMPFVKTPANVALTAIEYSPFGLAKNAVNTFKEVVADYKRSHGKDVIGDRTFNQQRFVRETSRNLVGIMLYALAIGMAQAGHLTGAYDDDDDMKQAQREAGMQEYAFVSPFTGNQWQTSWIPVIGNSAVAGAATVDAMKAAQDGEIPFLEGLKAGAASQFENSMLQGLSRLFGTQSSFSSDNILKNVGNTIKSAGTQLIPSIVRQVAAAMDPYQRDTRGIEPNDRYINSMISSLPFLRETLQPRIGRTGEELAQNAGRNTIQKWLDNLVNPAIVTTPNAAPDAVRDEAMRLHESLEGVNNTVANGAFEPYVTIKQITTDTHTPTVEEYTQYQRDAYGQMNSVAEQMIGTDYYQNLSDLEKAKALAKIYEAVRDSVRCDTVDGNVADLDAAARIYSQEGADALIEYVMTAAYRNQIGANDSQANNAYIQEQLSSGNYAALEQDMATSQELTNYGFDDNLTFKYNHAVQYIPSLTPIQFAQTWNEIDGTINPNGTVSQDEILAYLNQDPTSWNQADASMYWQAYLQNPSYQPYFNEEEGIWKKRKG